MNKDIVIKYLPNTTTDEELQQIRRDFKNKGVAVILIVSGKENLLDNLQSMLILTKSSK